MTVVPERQPLPVVDLSRPEVWQDLRGELARARADSPVARNPDGTLWVLNRDGVENVLRNRAFDAPNLAESHGGADPVIAAWAGQLLGSLNGEPHRRIRGLVAKAFSARTAEDMRPFIAATVGQLFDRYFSSHDLSVLSELPGRVMAHLFGLPDADFDTFAVWVDDLGQFFNYDLKNPAVSSRVHAAIEALRGYLAQIAESPPRPDSPDLMHRLLEPREEGTLSLDEAVVIGTNLLAAGTDTVSSSVRIACYLLATHPDQFALLRADPALVPNAVEELLRFEPASPLHVRRAVTDVEIEGCPVHAGEMVMLAPIMADRDPAVWDRPDELDVTRQGAPRTQIFGGGPHMCLGAALARVELQEFLTALAARAQRLEAHGTPRFQPFQTLRQMHDVDVDIIPAE